MSYQVSQSMNKSVNIQDKEKISAYLKWIDYNYPVIFEDVFKKYPKYYWSVDLHQWTNIFINNASINNIKKMRETYTNKTGEHWKDAKLSEVEKIIGYAYNFDY